MTEETSPPDVNLTHVSGISWPRSGHHLLVRMLSGYFGKQFVYCEFHQGSPTDPELKRCCKSTPCSYASRVNFTKNHDFHLEVPQIEGQKYLVQYRDFVPSVVSNFELAVRAGQADTMDHFKMFVSKQFDNYLDFTTKWVTSPFARDPNVLRMPYDDLVEAPEITLGLAVRHLAPDHAPDEKRIQEIVARVDGQKVSDKKVHILRGSGVHNARRVENFRFYQPNLFGVISRMRLRRSDVMECFDRLLGRAPSESNMIHLQARETLEELEDFIKSTAEFSNRQGKAT